MAREAAVRVHQLPAAVIPATIPAGVEFLFVGRDM
jgi:hypothetical protein